MPKLTDPEVNPDSVTIQELPPSGACANELSEVFGEQFSGSLSEGSSTSSSSRDGAEENAKYCTISTEPIKQHAALIVQGTSTKVRLTIIKEDGSLSPLQNEDGKYSIPFWMAMIKTRFFVFGPDVLKYSMRAKTDLNFKKHFKYWDIGLIIQYNHPWRDKIFFDEQAINITGELLIGMFLHYLKTLAETKSGLKFDKVFITVPLRFGVLHRQRLKDAGTIAGFDTMLLINEISISSYLHVSSKTTDLATSGQVNFLAVSENSGKIEVAYFRSNLGILEMLACTGTLMKEEYQELKKIDDKNNLKRYRVTILEKLLKDLGNKIQLSEKPPSQTEVILFCEDRHWISILEEQKYLDCKGELIVYEHLGAPPITINLIGWNPPTAIVGDLCGDVINDIHPFAVYRSDESDSSISNEKVKLIGEDSPAETKGVSLSFVTNFPTTKTVMYQKDIFGREFSVGTLDITRVLYYRYFNLEIQPTLAKDGTVRLEEVFGCNSKGEHLEELESPTEYRWIPTGITPNELDSACKNCQEFIKSGEKYKKVVSEIKEDLWEICEGISEKIWHQCFKKGVADSEKKLVNERINRVLEVLRTRTSFETLVELNLETIERYKTEMEGYFKYFG